MICIDPSLNNLKSITCREISSYIFSWEEDVMICIYPSRNNLKSILCREIAAASGEWVNEFIPNNGESNLLHPDNQKIISPNNPDNMGIIFPIIWIMRIISPSNPDNIRIVS